MDAGTDVDVEHKQACSVVPVGKQACSSLSESSEVSEPGKLVHKQEHMELVLRKCCMVPELHRCCKVLVLRLVQHKCCTVEQCKPEPEPHSKLVLERKQVQAQVLDMLEHKLAPVQHKQALVLDMLEHKQALALDMLEHKQALALDMLEHRQVLVLSSILALEHKLALISTC